MTSEVAILNKVAVVVAADSAVTVGKSRVHRSANKIFNVSDVLPIGIMIYGYADFAGVPWETVIKSFRKEYGHRKFDTVNQCSDVFTEYLKSEKYITNYAEEASVGLIASDISADVSEELVGLTRRECAQKIDATIGRLRSRYLTAETIDGLEQMDRRLFSRKFRDLVFEIFRDVLESSPVGYQPPLRVRTQFVDLVHQVLATKAFSDFHSGVVVFGFGASEIMPSLRTSIFDGVYNRQLRYVGNSNDIDVSRELGNDVFIVPFAARNIIELFMEGVSTDLKRFFSILNRSTAEQVAERVIKDNFSPSKAQYKVIEAMNKKTIDSVLNEYNKTVSKWIHEKYVSRVLEVVRQLPKEEIAAMAEAIVELTAIKTKVSSEVETVSGPIDVAVVTKGDGFVWIKRKHYFDLSKNVQYLHTRFGNITLSALSEEVENGTG